MGAVHGVRLGQFQLDKMFGFGGTSLVFVAKDLSFRDALGMNKVVTLKILFDRVQAQAEAERLIQMSDETGVTSLHDYQEFEAVEIDDALKQLFTSWQAKLYKQSDEPIRRAYCLALHMEKGEDLTMTRLWKNQDAKSMNKGIWVVDRQGVQYAQYLQYDLNNDQKISLIKGLISAIKHAHDRFNMVHGDLHPGNVIYDPNTATVVIIDWGTVGVLGTDGWLTPWHDLLLLNEIQSLPKAADIHALALWIDRLLGYEDSVFRRQALRILSVDDAALVPTIGQLSVQFEASVQKVENKKHARIFGLIAMIAVFVILGLKLSFTDWAFLKMKEEITALTTSGLAQGSGNREALRTLRNHLHDSRYLQLRNTIVSGLGKINLKHFRGDYYLSEEDLRRPTAIHYAGSQSFVIFKGQLLFLGSAASSNEFVSDIDVSGIVLSSSQDGHRFIEFPVHPLAAEVDGAGYFLVYKSNLKSLLYVLAEMHFASVRFDSNIEPQVFGLIRGSTSLDVYYKLLDQMDCSWVDFGQKCNFERPWLRMWELPDDFFPSEPMSDLVVDMLKVKLEYEIEDMPLKLSEVYFRDLDLPQVYRMFRYNLYLCGFLCEADPCGNSILITEPTFDD